MITLDRKSVEDATLAMCDAAQMPVEAQMEQRYRHQVIAFVLALRKNYEREQTYDGLWEQYGLLDCANNAKSKAIRMGHHAGRLEDVGHDQDEMAPLPPGIELHDDAMDDALDLINYGAFCARLIDKSAHEFGLEKN